MKKLMILAVGLMFVFGTTATFAQEKTEKTEKKAPKKGKKGSKKDDTKKDTDKK
jgi:hypothetical protein